MNRGRRATRPAVALVVSLVGALLSLAPAGAQPAAPNVPPAGFASAPPAGFASAPPAGFASAPQRYLDEVFPDITRVDDVPYNESIDADTGLETHYADIYSPTGDTATLRPLIIWIHGGSFSFGDEDDMFWAAEASTHRGYVAASISYRLRDDTSGLGIVLAIRDALLDAQSAVRFFRTNAATYGIDPSRIMVGGYSAGAVTALNVVFNEELAEVGSPSSSVLAAVSMAGAFGGQPEPGDAPIVMFSGTADTTVPYANAVAQCDAQLAARNVCEFHSYPGEGHILSNDIDEIIELSHEFLYRFTTCGEAFSDVPATHAFCGDIDWMATNGLSTGYADGGYHPTAPVTRQAAVAFLWKMAGSPVCGGDPGFSDVGAGHAFYDAIAWAAANDIVGGFADGTFRPPNSVTRQAFVAFLWRIAGSPTGAPDPGFSDVGTGHAFYDAIAWAAANDIVGGFADGTFRPANTVSRQATSAFLHRGAPDLAPPAGCPI